MMLPPLLRLRQSGFTVMEMMVVLVIIGILSALATPSIQNGIIRKQIEAALPLADVAKKPIEVSWLLSKKFPSNNKTKLPVCR